jgi:SAM-dependent methyltransferase
VYRKIRESILKTGWSWGLYTPPDRRMLERILADFAARADCRRVLFVGVKAYNEPLRALFAGRTFATIDPTPSVARYGGDPHFVDVLQNLDRHVEPDSFDLVVMNGVIGFGLDAESDVEAALVQVHRALRPTGDLVFGINERIPTHVDLRRVDAMRLFRPKRFEPLAATRRVIETPFREETHTFEFWEKPSS